MPVRLLYVLLRPLNGIGLTAAVGHFLPVGSTGKYSAKQTFGCPYPGNWFVGPRPRRSPSTFSASRRTSDAVMVSGFGMNWTASTR